ncbi:MAG TPA: hypothetical protein VF808_19370 [Ktedonobacterales bacterium]
MVTAQTTPTTSEPTAHPRGNATLFTLTLIGLVGAALLFGYPVVRALAQGGRVPPPPLIFVIADLVAIAIVATRWRWGYSIALFVGAASLLLDLSPGYPLYQLTHPAGNFTTFGSFVAHVALNALATIASGTALIQVMRKRAFYSPRWMQAAVTGVVCLAIGALLVGATAQVSGGSASAAAGTESVHLAADTFAPDIIALHKGDTLTVINDVGVPHILANGTWSASGQAQPGAEPNAPVIKNVQISSGSVVLGPFTSPGTYHILCIVHPGMDLTVIVQ